MLIRLCLSCFVVALLWMPQTAFAQGAASESTASESTAAESTADEPADEFTVQRYRELEQELQELDLARVVAEPDTDARLEATQAAIQHRRELMTFITGWMRAGTLPSEAVGQAREARLVLVENIVQLSVEIGDCDDARASLSLIRGFSQGDVDRQATYDAAVDAVESCVPAETRVAAGTDDPGGESGSENGNPTDGTGGETDPGTGGETGPGTGGETDPGTGTANTLPPHVPIQISPARPVDIPAVVTIGVGSTLLISAAGVNFARWAGRDDYLEARTSCEELGVDCGTAESERATLHRSKRWVSGLLISGAVVTTVGALLQVYPRRDRDSARVRVAPTANGVAFTFGRVHP